MISSFFSKSKPIHFVVISIVLAMVFVLSRYFAIQDKLSISLIFKQVGLFFVCLFSIFVLDFFASRNNLTQKSSYKILLFTLFIALFPQTIMNSKVLLSNFFILLAIRRLISLRSHKEIKKKLFDAAFWISIAALLYFWAIIFYGLIVAALILYAITDFKNWIVPLVGVLTVLIICVSYMIVRDVEFLNYFKDTLFYGFDFSQLNSKRIIIAATLFFSYGLWSTFYFFKHLKDKSKNHKASFVLVFISALLAMLIIIVTPIKNGSEFIFLFAPMAIIITNYFEVISEKWFKEALIFVLMIAPIAILML
ncbi:DUF6427 family protein [Ichthyenterobacterium magnum]|uniref:Uncharacterized protein n=1 Tax=Ichthyenterobacterium magnum TaxID=1230530 RepID=A0A420DXB2_9FLAO|nr:DUF6427 family protein [Ichthyenterobacterium magnum]RKE98849.1 hypothetical protein BXY80_0944 [Ichthyenterobacterium magnum]